MTHEEAEALVGFLRAAPGWGHTITDDQAKFFHARLTSLKAMEGSTAILNGIKVWEFAPSWASVIEFYKIERAKAQAEERVDHGYDLPPKGEIPFWVKRWLYARFIHVPPDTRWFLEQCDFADGEREVMPPEAYINEAQALTTRQLNAAVQVAFGPRGKSDEEMIGILRDSLGLSAE